MSTFKPGDVISTEEEMRSLPGGTKITRGDHNSTVWVKHDTDNTWAWVDTKDGSVAGFISLAPMKSIVVYVPEKKPKFKPGDKAWYLPIDGSKPRLVEIEEAPHDVNYVSPVLWFRREDGNLTWAGERRFKTEESVWRKKQDIETHDELCRLKDELKEAKRVWKINEDGTLKMSTVAEIKPGEDFIHTEEFHQRTGDLFVDNAGDYMVRLGRIDEYFYLNDLVEDPDDRTPYVLSELHGLKFLRSYTREALREMAQKAVSQAYDSKTDSVSCSMDYAVAYDDDPQKIVQTFDSFEQANDYVNRYLDAAHDFLVAWPIDDILPDLIVVKRTKPEWSKA